MRLLAPPMLLAQILATGCASRVPDAGAPAVHPLQVGTAEAGAAGRVVPLDLLQVTVFEAPELSATVRVSESGELSLPLVGVIATDGLTVRELEAVLVTRLAPYMREPKVTIEVKEAAPQPVYVLGEVIQPGAFTAADQKALTILQAVAMSRGFKPSAAISRAVVIRSDAGGERQQVPVNLDHVLSGKLPDLPLQPNDILYVPKNSERAVALGAVDALLRVITFRAVF